MIRANRMKTLPPYIFAKLNKKIETIENGGELINLGIGDPDEPTPDHIVIKAIKAIRDPVNHRYPAFNGLKEYRKSISDFYLKRYNVSLDHNKEVLPLIGSKEGIAHISLCYVNPGDLVLIPDPSYPAYGRGSLIAGGENYSMPLLKENNYLPDLQEVPEYIAKSAKLMFLNYPNNPTGSLATKEFFQEVVDFARENKIIVCHDMAYGDIAFDGHKPISFLETPGAKEVGVEFGSLSKPYNMTGWRVGYVLGNQEIIETLLLLKSNMDSGIFKPIQSAAIEALGGEQFCIEKSCQIYSKRRDLVVKTLSKMGLDVEKPKATFYIWVKVPSGFTSETFAEMVLEKSGVIVTPGNAFGAYGEGYIRISLTAPCEKIKEAMKRIAVQLTTL